MRANLTVVWFVLISTSVVTNIGCSGIDDSTPADNREFSFENASGQIRYEGVDGSGVFNEHQIVDDPMSEAYERGVWSASRENEVVTLNAAATTKNRVHIVFVGDGYTSSQISDYAKDVQRSIQLLSREAPFKNYASYFAFHRVDVVSKESGVTNDPNGKSRKTALGMNFYCSGIERLLCANANKVMAAAQNAPGVDQVFALANSSRYGGAGYTSPPISTLAARNEAALELALHEFGHSFGKLADEYDYSGGNIDCQSMANVSKDTEGTMKSKKSKWWRWLDLKNVGAYTGNCYSQTAYYRPTYASKMRALGNSFEEVNNEQLILQIYKRVKPVDQVAPAAGSYTGHRIIEVTPMRPLSHSLDLVWSVNGKQIADLTGLERIDTSSLGLPSGTNTISVKVTDKTSDVRDENIRTQYMTQVTTWTIKL